MKTEQDNLAAQFLLGKLSEEENIKIEEVFFSKNDYFENVLIAENELIESYVSGTLSPEDQKRFESRMLLNPRQRQRVEFANMLVKYASSLPTQNENPAPSEPHWLSAFLQSFSLKLMPSFSFAVAALVFFVGVIWLTSNKFNSQFNQLDELVVAETPQPTQNNESIQDRESVNETSERNEIVETELRITQPEPKSNQPISPQIRKEAAPIVFSLVLSPGLTRDAGASQRFTIPAKTKFVKMQLKFEQGEFSSYQAVLETVEGHQIWNSNNLKVRKDEKVVTVLVPSILLKKFDYILSLKGITKEGVYEGVENYTFTINDK